MGIGFSAVKEIVQKHADEKRTESDKLPSFSGGNEVSPSTVPTYLTEFAQDEKISMKKNVAKKTVLRIAAENSLRSTVSYLMTIAATHFIEGKMPTNHPARTKHGTAGSQKMVNLIKDAIGDDVGFYPIHRSLLASTDDTTVFISPGKITTKAKDDLMLVPTDHDNKTQMYYKKSSNTDDENAKGMRVKLTFTFTGSGQVFNPYVTVSGITERELPKATCPSGILVVPIAGLSMERNRDPSCKKKGYVVFLRNDVSDESVHLKNHEHYHKEVYKPYIDYIRKVLHGYNIDGTDTVSDELQSVGWNDGDIMMLAAIVKEEMGKQCMENNNVRNKQSVKRTGVEQMCDVAVIFNSLKHIERSTTLKDIPFDSLSVIIESTFKDLHDDGILDLKKNKARILKDFLARLPYMFDKTCTCDRIMEGFVDVGMLDEKHKLWPDFYAILKTKRRSITKSEMAMIEKHFSHLFKIMVEKGHIPEDVYDKLGYPEDEVNGVVYERRDGIEKEWMQRAKIITHQFQQCLRLQRKKKLDDILEKKKEDNLKAVDGLIQGNDDVEKKLIQKIEKHNLTNANNINELIDKIAVENATLEMFSECKAPELKHFVHVRITANRNITKKDLKKFGISKLPNKGNLASAQHEVETNKFGSLIALAYHLRKVEALMK